MKLKQVSAAIVGLIAALLGGLWLLQGAGVLNVCPVLCFADCECVTGGSPFWAIAGAFALIIGITILRKNLRKSQ